MIELFLGKLFLLTKTLYYISLFEANYLFFGKRSRDMLRYMELVICVFNDLTSFIRIFF